MKPSPMIRCRLLHAFAIAVLLSAATALLGCGGGSRKVLYVVGTGTPSIQLFQVQSNGSLAATNDMVGTGGSPNALVVTPNRKFAYVTDSAGATVAGGVSQYTITSSSGVPAVLTVATNTSTTTLSNPTPPAPTGINPVALALSNSGSFLVVANQGSNSISVFNINGSTGLLTEIAGSQFPTAAGPTDVISGGNLVYVANQGAGQISGYTFDPGSGALTQVSGSPFVAGVSPRALAFGPSGKFLYVADTASNAILGFSIQSTSSGQIAPLSTASSPAGTAPVNLYVHASGKFLYVANQGSGNISAFTIDAGSGALTPLSGSPYAVGSNPSFITADSSGKFLFVANQGSANISVFSVGADGSLSAVSGSPFAAGVVNPVGLFSIN